MTQLYVQVIDGAMSQCWDTPPPVPVGQDGWKYAIEIIPATIPYQQGLNGPVYDCTKDPVEIVWAVYNISIDSRKSDMKGQNASQFNQVVAYEAQTETDSDPDTHYDAVAVSDAQTRYQLLKTEIEAAKTHTKLDTLQEQLNTFVPPTK
jgi:hypothetical protein